MGQAARWEKVAREWNGRYYPPKGLEQAQKVLAARDGYLAVIGITRRFRIWLAYVAIRFLPCGGTWRSLPEAIARDPAALKALGKKVFPHRLRKRLRVARGLLWFDRRYFLLRPDPARLAGVADAILAVLPRHVGRLDGRCEVCGTVPVAEPVLLNQGTLTYEQFLLLASADESELVLTNTPGYVCPGCLEKVQQEEARRERAFAWEPTHPVWALVAGAAVALVGGLLLAAYMVFLRGRHLYYLIVFIVSIPVALTVKVALGRTNPHARVLTPLLTLAGEFAGDVFRVAHLIRDRTGGYNLAAALQALLQDMHAHPFTTIYFLALSVPLTIICSLIADEFAGDILERWSSRRL